MAAILRSQFVISRWRFSGKVREKNRERSLKWPQLAFHRRPHDVSIDAELVMHEHMSHAGDLFPFDIGRLLTDVIGQSAGCLAENL
jgi:hypothetical protein